MGGRLRDLLRPLARRWRWLRLRRRVPSFVTFGDGCFIDPTVVFKPHDGAKIVLGDLVRIRRYGELCGPITIGYCSRMNRNVYIRPNVRIGDWVAMGAFVRIVTDHHEIGTVRSRRSAAVAYPEIVIEDEGEDVAWGRRPPVVAVRPHQYRQLFTRLRHG